MSSSIFKIILKTSKHGIIKVRRLAVYKPIGFDLWYDVQLIVVSKLPAPIIESFIKYLIKHILGKLGMFMETAAVHLAIPAAFGSITGNLISPVGILRLVVVSATSLNCPKGKGNYEFMRD